MTEQLMDEERNILLDLAGNWASKPLRIIDAHAADRAALVAQLEAAEQEAAEFYSAGLAQGERLDALVAQLEAAEQREQAHYARSVKAEADDQLSRTQRDVLQAEVGRLKEALAAAERDAKDDASDIADWQQHCFSAEKRAESAEARVRELLALLDAQAAVITGLRAAEARVRELEAAATWHDEHVAELRSRLAAANALLERINRRGGCGLDVHGWIDAHLAAQPATAPARTEAEQRVLDACAAIEFSYWEGALGRTSASLEAVLEAESARREASRG